MSAETCFGPRRALKYAAVRLAAGLIAAATALISIARRFAEFAAR